MIRSGDDLKRARHALGLSVEEMRAKLRLSENNGARRLREMEGNFKDVSGPIAVAVEHMLEKEGVVL